MQSELTLLAAGISIVLQYMNSSMEQADRSNWTLRASRCENMEEILKACTILLECCGRSDFMRSIYHLWALCSNAMFLFEQQWWARSAYGNKDTRGYPTGATEVVGAAAPWMAGSTSVGQTWYGLPRHFQGLVHGFL